MVGETLGHYLIEERLGAGGMGVVYRARDTRLERTVALKLLGDKLLSDEAARARLLNEARAASALNHPNICTVYEVGEAGGLAWIAMECVEGKPLSGLIPRDGLPLETALRYAVQIADALAHAHERGIVHRDLKSANVVITGDGRPKVLDFGLAKRLRETRTQDATQSVVSLAEGGAGGVALSGTLRYMAPEVLRGEPADARSDLWAFGVILHEMAAGAPPFDGKTGFELTAAILREPPAPLPPRVPPALRTVIGRCLDKEPGQRYQRASEARAVLEVVGSLGLGAPVAAPCPPCSEDAPRLPTGGRPSPNQEANEYFAVAALGRSQYHLPRMRQMLERALELDPHFAEARALYSFAHLLMINSGYSNDAGWLYKAEEEARRALEDDPASGKAHITLAAVYLYHGRRDLAKRYLEKPLAANPHDVDALLWLVIYHAFGGDMADAEELVLHMVERDPVYFPARLNLGWLMSLQGDMAGAIRQFEKMLEQDPQNFYAIHFLARVYMAAGDLPMARQVLDRSRPEDQQSYSSGLCEALLLALEGKRDAALKEMDEDLLKYAQVDIFATAAAAEFYAVLGETEKALEWLHRAVRNGDERGEWFARDPLLAGLRDNPRFRQILDSLVFRKSGAS